MNKLLRSPITFVAMITAIATTITHFAFAADNKEGRMTEVIKDVRLLASNAAPRPATINDSVREGTAVRTGQESRAEISFTDATLARLGANTVFSFGKTSKTYDLGSGAILMYAPEKAGEVRIHTSAATAAITGFTAMFEHHPKGWSKLIVLNGKARVAFKGLEQEPCRLTDAQMIMWPPQPRSCPTVYNIDVSKLLKGKLIKGFKHQLPEIHIIQKLADNQQNEPPPGGGGLIDPTNTDTVDQTHSGVPPQEHSPPPMHSPPPKRPN